MFAYGLAVRIALATANRCCWLAAAFCFVGALPLFWLMHQPAPGAHPCSGQFGFVIGLGMSFGALPALAMVRATPRPRCAAR